MRIISLVLLLCVFACAQITPPTREQRSRMKEIAKQYELKPMAKPSWATRDDKPLFRIAWFSDTHIVKEEQLPLMKAAFQYAKEKNADFAIFTGDNAYYFGREYVQLKPISKRKHVWFKAFLDSELKMPYKVICGDNWHSGFIECFGSRNFAFDARGFHFVFASLDARAPKGEGCAKFDDATLDWIREDLGKNASKPTLFVLHETIWPPTFLDALNVEALLKEQKNVFCVLGGHLHLDLDLAHAGMRYIVCPSLGRSHRPGFKLMNFYEDAIIIESCELNEAENTFFMADKWQRIPVPANLKPDAAKLDLKNTSEMAPVQERKDEELAQRAQEVYNALIGFAMSMGLQSLLK